MAGLIKEGSSFARVGIIGITRWKVLNPLFILSKVSSLCEGLYLREHMFGVSIHTVTVHRHLHVPIVQLISVLSSGLQIFRHLLVLQY